MEAVVVATLFRNSLSTLRAFVKQILFMASGMFHHARSVFRATMVPLALSSVQVVHVTLAITRAHVPMVFVEKVPATALQMQAAAFGHRPRAKIVFQRITAVTVNNYAQVVGHAVVMGSVHGALATRDYARVSKQPWMASGPPPHVTTVLLDTQAQSASKSVQVSRIAVVTGLVIKAFEAQDFARAPQDGLALTAFTNVRKMKLCKFAPTKVYVRS